ncbi:peptidase inhibitor family I36 protein [Phytomonospora endophytica]|uniref:Peptidase inhibitor family I36 n=1 Tax=Phytomonospora endophytica TaxID=714109 RepID=A0A841FRE6_9ACTN|nr:peptidase inhibitor family I36 protein [Phytomonospora endophytica]MBB6038626.1 hypothetical protein [Phytomonospora endophytica]GIG69230.1 hypothetical protein Pen01_55250 [Phytomonospora endophytica]
MLITCAAIVIALIGGESAAVAAPATGSSVQAQIDALLAQHPDGKQINDNEIAWENGAVVLTIPAAGQPTAYGPGEKAVPMGTPNCSYYWTCLYEHANYDGRRLRFSSCGYIQDLGGYGFNDQTTSWHNNQSGGARTRVYDWRGAWVQLWATGEAQSWNPNVGKDNNDKADGIKAC